MTLPRSSTDRLLSVHLTLSQYPILSARMRMRMRREMFERGIITPANFESEVHDNAIESQIREGLHDPMHEEPADVWEKRLETIRDQLTDTYFIHNFSFERFRRIVREVLDERGIGTQELLLSINPELAPQDLLFEQALTIEKMPAEERAQYEARLSESKVVLIRNMISDQLRYINIAKQWFTISDLAEIRRRKIGSGKIGGKAAGMLLAARILKQVGDENLRQSVRVPESYFLGSNMLYTFMSINNLVHWNDQKYKPEDQMRAEYPLIQNDFAAGEFPPDVLDKLQSILINVGPKPLIVRSSSLLEDNFGTSFAGKYDSIFCPNQGTPEQNLHALTLGIAQIYASTLNPNALLYRRSKGLQDYDERMAILIQVVEGDTFGRYYFPQAAGVAFSRNQYRWSPQIRREDGFMRLVWGLGTRAVDRVGNDYPRLVALSHPTLRPNNSPEAVRRYSQQYIDLIDLKENSFKTMPITSVLNQNYDPLRYIAQMDQDGYVSSLRTNMIGDVKRLIVTYEDMLRRTPFAERMRQILHLLERKYRSPVDMEFTAQVINPHSVNPEVIISILQCRPQSHLQETEEIPLPTDMDSGEMIFSTHFMVPQGQVQNIEYVLFVPAEEYFAIPTPVARNELVRAIGQVNAALADRTYICVGPGRWGTSNPDLGVPIYYGDIYNARALVEVSGLGVGTAPEPSLGTHFFQDLLEAQIYPLAINLDDVETVFSRTFFYESPNHLANFIPASEDLQARLRLTSVSNYCSNCHLDLIMDDDESQAVAFLSRL